MRNTEGVPWCLKMAEIDIPDPCFSLVPLPLLSRGTSRQETWVVVYARTATVHCVNTKTPPVFRPFSFTQPQRTVGLGRQHKRISFFLKGGFLKHYSCPLLRDSWDIQQTSCQETWVVVYARTATVHCVNTKTPPVFRPFSFTQPQRTVGLARQHRRVPYFCIGEEGRNYLTFLVN